MENEITFIKIKLETDEIPCKTCTIDELMLSGGPICQQCDDGFKYILETEENSKTQTGGVLGRLKKGECGCELGDGKDGK